MIAVGTCGYSYEDWRGAFYPRDMHQRDFLSYYVMHFRCLELNSSFYAIPSPSLVGSLVERTPQEFRVAVKAFRGITHERQDDPTGDMEKFLEAVGPLRESGKLACVLLQFPYSFHRGQREMDLLAMLIDRVQPLVPVVEFRNAEWWDEAVWRRLRELDAAICCVDEPAIDKLMPPETVMTSARMGYVRFHGRNAEKWFRHDLPEERYDYMYGEDELKDWVRGIRWLDGKTRETLVFFNNHRAGQAVRNARTMRRLLGIKPPDEAAGQKSMF